MQRFGRLVVAMGMAAMVAATTSARAHAAEGEPAVTERAAFERDWTLAGYLATWQGDYASIGLGGRLRFEPLDGFGLEVFAEAFLVDWPDTIRHDYPIGFNLYVPWALTDWLRVRPFAGMCAVFSLIEPAEAHAPRADDVLFGAHGGVGLEAALASQFSLFFDAKAQWYLGHDRTVNGWVQRIDDTISDTWLAQLALGVQLHL